MWLAMRKSEREEKFRKADCCFWKKRCLIFELEAELLQRLRFCVASVHDGGNVVYWSRWKIVPRRDIVIDRRLACGRGKGLAFALVQTRI